MTECIRFVGTVDLHGNVFTKDETEECLFIKAVTTELPWFSTMISELCAAFTEKLQQI